MMNTMGLGGGGVYIDPFLRRQKIEDMEPHEFLSVPISDLNQSGPLFAGPGAKRDVAASILGVALPRVERRDQDDIARAKKYAMEQSVKFVLLKQTLAHQQQQAKSLQRHQALVLMCRVYIGSISFELREDTIRQAFAPFGPIKTINMSWDPVAQKHKGFAFVEYDLPEAAQLALEQMNGVMIGGRNIKCGRDTRIKFSHMDQVIDELMDESKVYHRIYVASIHQDLTEDDIKSVFEAFGKIKACKLAPGPSPGKHRGYGFIEYEGAQSASEAIASMNLFDLGGQYLRVGKAITPPNALAAAPGQNTMPQAAAVAAAAATAKIQAMEAVTSNAAALGLTSSTSSSMSMSSMSSLSKPLSPAAATVITPPVPSIPTIGLAGFSLANTPKPIPPPIIPASSVLPPPGLATFSLTPPQQQQAQQSHHFTSKFELHNPALSLSHPHIPPPTLILQPPIPATILLASQIHQQQHQPTSSSSSSSGGAESAKKVAEQLKEELVKKLKGDEEGENASLSAQENVSIKGQSARHLVMQKLMRGGEGESSAVILLKNMVGAEEVDEGLQEEITEECNRFGHVKRVVIYQERQSEEPDAPTIVKIFVEFSTHAEAMNAKTTLHARFFGGRRVNCEIYDYNLYMNNDLSG